MKAVELAKLVGVDPVTMSRWETNESDIKLKDFLKILEVLNKSADEVLVEDQDNLKLVGSLIPKLNNKRLKALVDLLNE